MTSSSDRCQEQLGGLWVQQAVYLILEERDRTRETQDTRRIASLDEKEEK